MPALPAAATCDGRPGVACAARRCSASGRSPARGRHTPAPACMQRLSAPACRHHWSGTAGAACDARRQAVRTGRCRAACAAKNESWTSVRWMSRRWADARVARHRLQVRALSPASLAQQSAAPEEALEPSQRTRHALPQAAAPHEGATARGPRLPARRPARPGWRPRRRAPRGWPRPTAAARPRRPPQTARRPPGGAAGRPAGRGSGA